MNTTQTPNRIHPLMAGAAVSVTLVSLLGMAAITGILPDSHAVAPVAVPVTAQASPQQLAESDVAARPPVVRHATPTHVAPAPAHASHVAQAAPRAYTPAPASPPPAPAAKNSPIGIGVGAVLGGLIGNQVGGGNGKTLATIAGAVGGGYVGNEVAKRNQ